MSGCSRSHEEKGVPAIGAAAFPPEPLIERRRYPRLSVSAPVNFRELLKPHELFSGSLGRDLSASGVRFTAPTFVPRNTRLVTLLSLPGESQPIRTIAQVVWVQRRPSLEAYDYGVQFVEVTPQDQRTLADYVDRGVLIRS